MMVVAVNVHVSRYSKEQLTGLGYTKQHKILVGKNFGKSIISGFWYRKLWRVYSSLSVNCVKLGTLENLKFGWVKY